MKEVRIIRDWMKWTPNIDHEGFTPLTLLSLSLSSNLIVSKQYLNCTSVLTFGKSDFTLGVTLPNSSSDILKPRRIDSLNHPTPTPDRDVSAAIVYVAASKYHSLVLTKDGKVLTWGHGKGGRLGHGDEITQPYPLLIKSLSSIIIRTVATSENHTIGWFDITLSFTLDRTLIANDYHAYAIQ
jgi:hypothetical protein